MNDLENELRRTLTREEPSPDFVGGVLARIAAEEASRAPEAPKVVPIRRRRPALVYALAAAALVVAALGTVWSLAPRRTQAPATPAARVEREQPVPDRAPVPTPAKSAPPIVLPRPFSTPVDTISDRRRVRRAVDPRSAEAQRAKEKLLLALRITSEQLTAVRRQVAAVDPRSQS